MLVARIEGNLLITTRKDSFISQEVALSLALFNLGGVNNEKIFICKNKQYCYNKFS